MRLRRASALIVGVSALLALRCGGSTSVAAADGGHPASGVPAVHRALAAACFPTRDAGQSTDAGLSDGGFPGQCASDADCKAGTNGRCEGSRIGLTCEYDACFTDAECSSGAVCHCGGTTANRSAHHCVTGNCQVDSDCGVGGYCSPSLDFGCGPYGGIVGYYCHTAADECLSDSDCGPVDGSPGPGFCGYQPTVARWQCSHSFCVG